MRFCCLIIVFTTLLLSQTAQAERVLKFAADTDIYLLDAISVPILKLAYARLGIKIHSLNNVPLERSLVFANDGTIDGEVQRIDGISEQYPKLIKVTESFHSMQASIFTKKHHFEVNGWESIKGYSVGIIRGMKYAEQNTLGFKRILANQTEQLFDLLVYDRVDICIANRSTAQLFLSRMAKRGNKKYQGIIELSPQVQFIPLYHYLHKRHAALVPKITLILQEMKASGLIEEIKQKAIDDFFGNIEVR